ncbi:MAG TPA: DUF2157 domain-containing protein [Vicinamibacterales bacterium]|nr:DUF2157 domain-containing protein [Vicinamibacterales bacterium]
MSSKEDALVEVVDIIKRHNLSLADISSALEGGQDFKARTSSSILSRLFGYVGGIFIFVGLAIYVGMKWDDLNSAGRILLTLGSGFCAFVMALVCTTDQRVERAATPLFLVAALLQPTGIIVMLNEYSRGGDPAYGLLFMNAVMAIQQGCVFWAKQRAVLALSTIVFALGFFTIAFDLMHIDHDLIGVTIGASLMCVAWSLDTSRHKSIAPLCYFFGSIVFLSAAYHWLRHSPIEVLFLGLACGCIFISTVARSRTLLLVGTLALIGYLGDYIAEHFAHNLNAPLLVMLVGFLLIALGVVAVQINNRYIKETSGQSL